MTEGEKAKKTVIAEDVEITGAIKCTNGINIEGRLNGDLTCAASAIIGESASVKGNISVKATTVHGQVTGNIVAKDKIELKSTAKVNGDVRAKRMTIEDGVTFVGKSEVNSSGKPMLSSSKSLQEIMPESEGGFDVIDESKVNNMREEIRKNVQEEVKGKTGGLFGKK